LDILSHIGADEEDEAAADNGASKEVAGACSEMEGRADMVEGGRMGWMIGEEEERRMREGWMVDGECDCD
jgi:hypothetical protein